MQPGCVYVIGPGSSAKSVLDVLGLRGALLGTDAVVDRKLVGSDLNAEGILRIAGSRPTEIILGVIGGQGYVPGRGNQQISAALVRRIGRDNLTIMSSDEKLIRLAGRRDLPGPPLRSFSELERNQAKHDSGSCPDFALGVGHCLVSLSDRRQVPA